MLADATGAAINVGDRVGTVTSGQFAAIVIGEVQRVGAQMITVTVESSRYSGAPQSSYARLPKIGSDIRLNAWRVFRLGPCKHDQEEKPSVLDIKDLRFDVARSAAPGKHLVRVRVFHVPTGCEHAEEDYSELEAKAKALQVLEKIVAVHRGPQ